MGVSAMYFLLCVTDTLVRYVLSNEGIGTQNERRDLVLLAWELLLSSG